MHAGEDSAGRQTQAGRVIFAADGLPALFGALRGRGYTVDGPAVRYGAIVVAELASVSELPFGWGVESKAGRYRLRARAGTAAFGHSAGPQSWKSVLHPARARLWSADRVTGTVAADETAERPRYALLGVRLRVHDCRTWCLGAPGLLADLAPQHVVDRLRRAICLPFGVTVIDRLVRREVVRQVFSGDPGAVHVQDRVDDLAQVMDGFAET